MYQHDAGGPWVKRSYFALDYQGVAPVRTGGNRIGASMPPNMQPPRGVGYMAPPYYPYRSDLDEFAWSKSSASELSNRFLETEPLSSKGVKVCDGGERGLGYCYNKQFGSYPDAVHQHFLTRPSHSTVDGNLIQNSEWKNSYGDLLAFFQGDEFIFKVTWIGDFAMSVVVAGIGFRVGSARRCRPKIAQASHFARPTGRGV